MLVVHIPGSDHEAIQLLVRSTRPALVRHNRAIYNFKKAEFNLFRDLLRKISWHDFLLKSNIDILKVPNLEDVGKVLTSAVDKAEAFNHYFFSIFAKENIFNPAHLRSLLQATWSSESISDAVLDENKVCV